MVYNLLDELFEFDRESGWRRRVYPPFLYFLQFAFFGAANTILSRQLHNMATEMLPVAVLELVRDILWPPEHNRVFFTDVPHYQPPPPQSKEQITETMLEAERKFMNLIPRNITTVLGKSNTDMALRKVFDVLQHPILVKSLTLFILDEVLSGLFSQAHEELLKVQTELTIKFKMISEVKRGGAENVGGRDRQNMERQ